MKHIFLSFFFVAMLSGFTAKAETSEGESSETKTEGFNPGELIMEHIGDAYDWHIITVGEHKVAIPLPVIVYNKGTGFSVFSSSRLHHGATYAGYHIAAEGEANAGKIVCESGQRPTLDISITKNVLALFISIAILLAIFLSVAKRYKLHPNEAPKGLQSLLEPLILFVRDDIARPSIGAEYMKFMPFLLTVFFFIFINNVLGLIPIFPFGANLTGNIAVTLVLALLTFIITLANSNKHYWTDIFNTPGVPWWLKVFPLMPFIEFTGMFTKPFVLMIRLFANITAGHIVALGFICLIFIFGAKSAAIGYGVSIVSVLFVVFMTTLDLLVAFIQAYVFTLLSALYFGGAVEKPHHK